MPFSPDEPRDEHGRWIESGIKVGHAYHAGEYTPGTPYVVHVNAVDGDTVRIGSSAGSEYGPKVPRSAVKHLVNDMSGRIEGTPDSSSPEVNAVLRGEGEFLGRGDDGIAFRVGNKAVKASTVVPYQPMNDYYRTPKDAITRFREQIAVHNGLAYDGVPGVMPVQYLEHGDKAYAIQPFLDTKSTLTPEQLSAVKQSVEEMHKRGITVNDQIQVGVGRDGTVYHYDLGKASKAPTPQRLLDRIDDDHDQLKRLYQQHGQKYRRFTAEEAESMWRKLEDPALVAQLAREPGGDAQWEALFSHAGKATFELGDTSKHIFDPEWAGLLERRRKATRLWDDAVDAALEAAESAKPKGKTRMKKLAKGIDLHESRDDLTDQTLDLHRMLNSLCEELEAVDWYQQRIDATDDKGLARVLAHNRDEEIEHFAELLRAVYERHDGFRRLLDEHLRAKLEKGIDLMPPPSPNRKEYPFVGSLLVRGIPVAIENAKGSYREGTGKDGKKWRVLMHAHYGEIGPIAASGPGSGKKWNTLGTDGDRVDVYVLDHDPEYETVYIVDQLDPDTGEFDEQKVIFGASSSLDAKDLYFKQYDRPERFFGGIHAMPFGTFKRRLMGAGRRGELIKGFNPSEPRDENGRWTGDGLSERGQSETGKPKKIPWYKIRTSTAKIPKKLEDKVNNPEIWRRSLIRRHLGRNMPDDEIAALCGVDDAEQYHVSVDVHCVMLNIRHKGYNMAREFFKDKDSGDLVCINSYFEAHETHTGLGSKVFSRQVSALKDAGFKRMETLAARSDIEETPMNGYYTWPRLGYNAEIPSNVKLPPDLASAKTLHDLMKTPRGRAFWKRNGDGMYMNFDLSDGSDSMRVLEAYRQERGI